MAIKKTLGGDRLGSGKKMQVDLHAYERSTHDMGYLWRSTMSPGALVPFLVEVALPGDTFDINLDCDIKTHPTIGPLFGSYKVQLDIFQSAIRLYQGQLHNNKLGIGMNMANIKLPLIRLECTPTDPDTISDMDNAQINPSCLLAYLGIRGVGFNTDGDNHTRNFNALPLLSYWDIYKNYYANKQEEDAAFIFTSPLATPIGTEIDNIQLAGTPLPQQPATINFDVTQAIQFTITYDTVPEILNPAQIIFNTSRGPIPVSELGSLDNLTGTTQTYRFRFESIGAITIYSYRYITSSEIPTTGANVAQFTLSYLDDMREEILVDTQSGAAFIVNDHATPGDPFYSLLTWVGGASPYLYSQQGIGLKTYQSDLLNNWLSEEFIDGVNGITEITKVSTVGDAFTIDSLNLAKKVYEMLNRIAVSGGSYDDWLDAVYTHDRFRHAETPIYHGGLIKELVFQEVVSNSESSGSTDAPQPLGTLAGKGIMAQKHKGGKVTIKVDEPSYIMGIISLTPRIDYSQGNKWDTGLLTMDDFHKPALDEIGFQDLITEQMHWADTFWNGTGWTQRSAGKQPAWINYMTNINITRGNFAIQDNEMFMTLNRRYEVDEQITDITTYIDPMKFNFIFADTALDAQNFWAQISVDMTVRRKMSAKIMPNL